MFSLSQQVGGAYPPPRCPILFKQPPTHPSPLPILTPPPPLPPVSFPWTRASHSSSQATPPPLCDIPSGRCFFGQYPRLSLRVLRRVAAFWRPLRPVFLLASFACRFRAPPPPPRPQATGPGWAVPLDHKKRRHKRSTRHSNWLFGAEERGRARIPPRGHGRCCICRAVPRHALPARSEAAMSRASPCPLVPRAFRNARGGGGVWTSDFRGFKKQPQTDGQPMAAGAVGG